MSATEHSRERVTEVNAAYHDAIAEKYDMRGEGTSPHVLGWLQQIFDNEIYPALDIAGEKPHVIDWGIGSGYLEHFLDGRDVDLVGMDVSDSMLARGRERYPWARFEHGDVYTYEPERQYHLSMEHAVLHHLVDYETLVDKMARATLPGGVLLLGNEPNHRAYKYLKPLAKLYRNTVNRYRTKDAEALLGDADYEALSEYHLFYGDGISANKIKRKLMDEHGFRRVSIHYSLAEIFASLEEAQPRVKLNSITPKALRDNFPLSRNFTLVAHR